MISLVPTSDPLLVKKDDIVHFVLVNKVGVYGCLELIAGC
jgi:hypothetical protein